MHLDRRSYCYSYSQCDQDRTTRNIIYGVGVCFSLLSLVFGMYRYNQMKKKRKALERSTIPEYFRAISVNRQPNPKELDPNCLPPYSNLQGTVINPNTPQYATSPNIQVSAPSNVNDNQSSYPPVDNVSNLNPLSDDHSKTLNNSETIQYPAPAQPTLGQRQAESANTNTNAQQGRTEQVQPTTTTINNSPSNGQST